VSTLGASIFLQASAEVIWGAEVRGYPILFPQKWYTVGGARISLTEIVTLVVAVGLMVGLQAYIKWGKLGKAMRAVAQDRQAAALMGVNVNQVIAFVFAVGSAMGAAGGLLTGTYYGYAQPAMGFAVGVKGFIAAIVGGMGSVAGAGLGGFLIGMTEVLGGAYISYDYKEVILFTVLLLTLLVRPSGILGRYIREKV
jgi:branched-chain amino acid transport system permease protein